MSEHYRASIEALRTELQPLEEKVLRTKQLINLLCERAGVPPLYPEAERAEVASPALMRGDEYFNKPLNTSVRKWLTRRHAAKLGPATAEEIYHGLLAGGYDNFPANKEDALTGLRISLGKSSHTFVRLPNGSYGLAEWYDIKRSKSVIAKSRGDESKNGNSALAEEASLPSEAQDEAETITDDESTEGR